MIKIKLSIAFLFLVINIWAQTATRNIEYLAIEKWETSLGLNESIDLRNEANQLFLTDTIYASIQFKIEEDFNAFALYCKNLPRESKIVLNQTPISFSDNHRFEITDYINFENNTLQIIIPIKKSNSNKIQNVLNSISIESFKGAGILFSELVSLPEDYGNQINIHLANFFPTDFDGKIYASILDPISYDVIAKNNNCAFLPSGLFPVVEIPFYKLEYPLEQKKYLVELSLVDKQKEEAIIDEWSAEISFE